MIHPTRVREMKGTETLRQLACEIPDHLEHHPAFISSVENRFHRVTYGEVKKYVQMIGTSLSRMGIGKDDKVAVLSENRSEWPLAYLSVVSIGAIIVPLDILLTPNDFIPLLNDSEAKLIFVSKSFLPKIQEILPFCKYLKRIVVFDPVPETEEHDNKENHRRFQQIKSIIKKIRRRETILFEDRQYIAFEELDESGKHLIEDGDTSFFDMSVKKDDTAALIYTSGTTGKPKGVMLTHFNIASNADAIHTIDEITPDFTWVNVLPLHHTFPTIAGFFVPFFNRCTTKYVATLRPNVIMDAFKSVKVNAAPVVPLLLEKMYKGVFKKIREKGFIPNLLIMFLFRFSQVMNSVFGWNPGKTIFKSVRKQMGLEHLHYFVCGGGPVSKEVLTGFNIMGIFVAQGYGLTETTPVISINSLIDNRFGSVGRVIIGCEVKIDDPDVRGNGEILTRGNNLMKGYYNDKDQTAKVIDSDGWFHTGDIGRLDKDGFLFITGRLKNIIVTGGGKNIYPEEVEKLISKSIYIAEIVIVGRKAAKSDAEQPVAVIYPDFEAIAEMEKQKLRKFSEAQLKEFMKAEVKKFTSNLASYKVPVDIVISYEELPKVSKGEVKRYLIRGG